LWQAERLGGFGVDPQSEGGRLAQGELSRFVSLENSPGIDARLSIGVGEACRIADETASCGVVADVVDGRNGMARGQCDESSTFAAEEWASAEHERAGASLNNSCEGTIEFAFIRALPRHDFPLDGATRLLQFTQFVG